MGMLMGHFKSLGNGQGRHLVDHRKTQAICSAAPLGERSLSTRYLFGLKNRLSNTDLKNEYDINEKG